MLAIIFPYRNRDLQRLKNSFDSLKIQSENKFEVFFVDYGSEKVLAHKVKKLCEEYDFIKYVYHHTQFQPWNKCRALNSVIKYLGHEFCFVADVDMIFHPDFVSTAIKLQKPQRTTYFQVGFLKKEEDSIRVKNKDFDKFRKSTSEATGLSMFPVQALKEVNGFDEFYHLWGAEDTDIHVRLKNAHYEVQYFDKEVLLLHQWHPSYRSKETDSLTEDIKIKDIVQLNQQHLLYAIERKLTKVNLYSWGKVISAEEAKMLKQAEVNLTRRNEKRQVDDLIYGQLPVLKNQIFKVCIILDPFQRSFKYQTKKILGKKVPFYYTLKEVNDLILLHLISFYRHYPYSYQVDEKSNKITFGIIS